MSAAFVLGNGVSRLAVDLTVLKQRGTVYGCNALYREFVPNVLISTDKGIAHTIQHTGYAREHVMYTRKPLPGLGARSVPQSYFGFSSGPIAVGIAAMDKHLAVYLIGFDMGPTYKPESQARFHYHFSVIFVSQPLRLACSQSE